jgi:hypothetical protein
MSDVKWGYAGKSNMPMSAAASKDSLQQCVTLLSLRWGIAFSFKVDSSRGLLALGLEGDV